MQQSQIMKITNNNINKIPESDVLIPTSNLQKFIESADKILKNISVQQQQLPPQPAAAPSSVAIIDTPNKCEYNYKHIVNYMLYCVVTNYLHKTSYVYFFIDFTHYLFTSVLFRGSFEIDKKICSE